MEGPRACKKEELRSAIDLIEQTFRLSAGFETSMERQFPLLLSYDNLENMRVMVDNGQVAADVNFYKSNILINGAVIKAASVGAVCTGDNYRGFGYASTILDDVEAKMKQDGVEVMLVSGARNLYLRRGCTVCGLVNNYDISPEDNEADVYECGIEETDDMAKIYSFESVRYYRSNFEFKKLYEGAVAPWADYTFKTYIIKNKDKKAGYIVLKIKNNEKPYGVVVEFAGNRELVFKAIKKIAYKENLSHIEVYATFNDDLNNTLALRNIECKTVHLEGTVKIINFESLMESLKPYFKQLVQNVDSFKFYEENGKFVISSDVDEVSFSSMNDICKIVFGHADVNYDSFEGKSGEFIKTVFPIPFVWPGNMNFQ